MWRPKLGIPLAAIVAGVLWMSSGTSGQSSPAPSTKNGEWPHYTADLRGTKYSPLDQINASNFKDLEVAWRFKTDSLGTRPEYKLEGTPLMVGGVLYTTGGTRRSVVALDARTGELLWVHRYPEGTRGANAPRQLSGRGVAYWTDGRGDDRVLYVTPGYRLIALNAKTGVPDPVVRQERRRGHESRRRVRRRASRSISRPARSACTRRQPSSRTSIIVGSSMKEGMTITTHNNTKGLVRAFDARTGKVLWTFNTIPRPGEFGNDTWLNGSWAVNGNAGVWTQITVDEELGLVYLPVESPSSDYYGGKRPGNNLYGESLVCVDLKTGQRKWHFQLVHHPIWDHDISSAPILLDVTIDGRLRKLVAQPTKQSFLYVFDRVTGEPIWPIVETAGAAGRCARRVVCADAADSEQAARVRPSRSDDSRRTDRLHAGDARAGDREHEALQVGRQLPVQRHAVQPADRRQRQRAARRASISATRAAARTGLAPAPIRKRASSTRRRTCRRSRPNRSHRRLPASRTFPIRLASWVSRSACARPPARARMPTCRVKRPQRSRSSGSR